MSRYKKILILVLFYGNILMAVLLLVASAALIVPPSVSWVPSLLCLGIPVLLLMLLLLVLCWLFIERRRVWISIAAVLISLPFTYSVFSFHPFNTFSHEKMEKSIRVLSWNVGLMNYEAKDSATASDKNKVILDSLKQVNADVICLQEFFTAVVPGNPYNILDSISSVLKYPYYYYSYDYPKFNGEFYSGNVIFSRYKMIDSSRVVFQRPFPGCLLKAGLLVGSDTIDVINTRLQSVQFGKKEYKEISDIRNGEDSILPGTRNIISKLKSAFIKREGQAKQVAEMIDQSRRALIVTIDMNDVPASYAYTTIKGNMHDVWLNKGFGAGRTFRFISPTLRIDHIFYSNAFSVSQVKRIKTGSSDHYGLVADISFKR